MVNDRGLTELPGAPWLRIVALRTPTLPPATHTNVYLVGRGALVVVDPASPYPEEQAALDHELDALQQAGERVAEIVLTHHHLDHVSGAAHLSARLGVPIAAHAKTAERLAGRITVSRLLDDGERLAYGSGGSGGGGGGGLRVLFTPGHAPGHLALFDEAAQAVLVGDLVASVGTIIVAPDDGGDMALYLDSLARVAALNARWLLPAHGPPISDPQGKLAFYRAHRLEREARVVAALSTVPQSVAALVPLAYPEVAPAIYPLAAQSLLAHLIKLEREGRATRTGDGWRRC